VFKNRVLRILRRPKRDEMERDWRRLHTEDHYDLHYSPNVIWVIKSRIMRRAGHVAHMDHRRDVYGIFMGDLRNADQLEVRIFTVSGKGQVENDCECGSKTSGFTKSGNLLTS
jgi:hypothetical protein